MKLRLPNRLIAALLSAAAVGTFAQQASADTWAYDSATNTTTLKNGEGTTIATYAGRVYTWMGLNNAFHGSEEGSWTYVSDENGTVEESAVWGSHRHHCDDGYDFMANGGSTDNATYVSTLRFTSDATTKPGAFGFGPLNIAGIIVESGATGYSVVGGSSARAVILGNNNVNGYTDIAEDFTLGSNGGTVTFRATQTINVAQEKTFTINSGNSKKVNTGDLTITGGGTVSLQGNGIVDNTGTDTDIGSITVDASKLYINNASANNLGSLTLKNGTLEVHRNGDNKGNTNTISSLEVVGSSAIGTQVAGSCWQGLFAIGALVGDSDSSLKLYAGSQVVNNTVFHLNGGEGSGFHGNLTISVDNTNATGTRRIAADINENAASLFSDTVVTLASVNTNSKVALGINADNVTLKGLQTQDSNGTKYIFSGAVTSAEATDFNGDETSRTLTIDTGDHADAAYTFAGGIKSGLNLVKSGTGTQTLSGDLSAFNGNLTVNSGTLEITGTTLPQDGTGTLGTIALNGGTLKIGSGDGSHTSLSSFSSVTMAGGVLYYNNKKDTLHDVTAQADTDSRIFSLDMGKSNEGNHLTLAGTTTLNGNLTIHNYWNASFVVAKLTGAGTLNVTGGTINGAVSNASNEAAEMTISSLQGFTGYLTFNNSKLSATVNTGDAAVSMRTLTVSNHSAVTVTSSSTATLTASALALSGNASLGATALTLNGAAVTVSGNITANGGGSVNVTGTSAITASKIVVDGNNTKLSFGQHVTLTHNDYTSFSGSGKELHFNGGMSYTGTGGQHGYALVIGNGSKAYFGGETDLSQRRVGQNSGSEIIVESGASLKVKSMYNSTGTPANNGAVTVRKNAAFEAVSEGMVASVFTNAGTSVIRGGNMEITSKLDNSGTLTFHNSGSGKVATMTQTGENAVLNLSDNVAINTSLAQDGSVEGSINLGSGASLNIKNLGAEVSASLKDLTLAQNAVMGVYTDGTTNASAEANISVNGTLTSKTGATLNANLTLNNGATLAVAEGGLHMGSTLTIANGAKVNLSTDIISGLNSLTVGNGLTLFSGVDAFTIGGSSYNADTTYHASDYFKLDDVNRPWDFVIKYETPAGSTDGGTVSLWMETPEPATSTLSLLALAALAARRKRK